MPEESYYPDPDDQTDRVAPPEAGDAPMSETATLPKSFLGADIEVGDTCTLKVVRVLDDEVEVDCVKDETEPPSESDREIDAMAMEE